MPFFQSHGTRRAAFRLFLLFWSAWLFAPGPVPGPRAEGLHSRAVHDDLGRPVTLKGPPRRIISLAPSTTETLFAMGLGHAVVGVSAVCDYPEAVIQKAVVGMPLNHSLEQIVALDPDLMIVVRGLHRPELIDQLEKLRIPVYIQDPATLPEILAGIRRLGNLTAQETAAEELAGGMERDLDAIRRAVSGVPRRRVLYLLWHDPLITLGPGSFIHDLIELAGGRNVFRVADRPYTQINMELVVREDPEVVIIPTELGDSVADMVAQTWRRRWPMLTAVREGRIQRINSDWLHRPGPRIVLGARALARAIHPEVKLEGPQASQR